MAFLEVVDTVAIRVECVLCINLGIVLKTIWTSACLSLFLIASLPHSVQSFGHAKTHIEFQNTQCISYLSEFFKCLPLPHLPDELLTFQVFSDYVLLLGVLVFLVLSLPISRRTSVTVCSHYYVQSRLLLHTHP